MDIRLTPLTPKIQVPVLYEDENCVVFNKPSGLLVIPTDKNEHHTLVNIVNQQDTGGAKVIYTRRTGLTATLQG